MHIAAPLCPELLRARLHILEEKSEAAALERQLEATGRRLVHACPPSPPDGVHCWDAEARLRSEISQECARITSLSHMRHMLAEETEKAQADSFALRKELLSTAARLASVQGESLRLKAILATAEHSMQQTWSELHEVSRLHDQLEKQCADDLEEASKSSRSACLLRHRLDEKGWGLAWLRSTARNHVEGMQGSATILDQQIRNTVSQAPLCAALPAPTGWSRC